MNVVAVKPSPGGAGLLNMSGNLPPKAPEIFNKECRQAFDAVLSGKPPSELIGAHQFNGSAQDRVAGAMFIGKRLGSDPTPERVLVTNGTQSAITMLLAGLVGNKGVLAVEELTYPTIRQFAKMMDIEVVGVAMDRDGLLPDRYEEICRSAKPAALYTLPTLQNPTTSTMPAGRRRAIAEISQRYNVSIIEDDIYGPLKDGAPPPISAFAPEISWYILGTAKCIIPALKIAYVMAPNAPKAEQFFWPGVRATYWMCAPVNAALTSYLIEGGGADRVIQAVRKETQARQSMVKASAIGNLCVADPEGLHVWLEIPITVSSKDFVEQAAAEGVAIGKGDIHYFGDGAPPNAIRFGTGGPPTRELFERGLKTILNIMRWVD